ncbi:MAG: hypothetical protein HW400_204 [Candidatus Levybacteria bacterium]|nr:hypothetical protein [Candidatus Levybacteria bacterium]
MQLRVGTLPKATAAVLEKIKNISDLRDLLKWRDCIVIAAKSSGI